MYVRQVLHSTDSKCSICLFSARGSSTIDLRPVLSFFLLFPCLPRFFFEGIIYLILCYISPFNIFTGKLFVAKSVPKPGSRFWLLTIPRPSLHEIWTPLSDELSAFMLETTRTCYMNNQRLQNPVLNEAKCDNYNMDIIRQRVLNYTNLHQTHGYQGRR